MYIFTEITNPPNTLASDPLHTIIPLSAGLLTGFDISFPEGCYRLARLQIFYHGRILVPFNLAGSLGYNNITLQIPMNYRIDTAPFDLDIITWNLDDTFSHTLNVGVNIDYETLPELNPQIALTTPMPGDYLERKL